MGATAWLIAGVCALGCTSSVRQPAIEDPARTLRDYTSAFNRGSLSDLVALLSPDVVVLGIDDCRGRPCVGLAAVQDGWLGRDADEFYKYRYARENFGELVEGDRVTVHFSTRPGQFRTRGAEHVRGLMRFTTHAGKITRIENMFDLADPETVVIRHSWGEVVMAVRGADGAIVARVLLAKVASTPTVATTLISLQLVADRHDLVVRLGAGTCAAKSGNSQELHLVEGLDREGRIDLALDTLLATPFKIDLTLADGTPVGCGELPTPPT